MFARVDCSVSQNVCEYMQVTMIPEIRLLNNTSTPFDGKILDFRRNEQIDNYLNRYLGWQSLYFPCRHLHQSSRRSE